MHIDKCLHAKRGCKEYSAKPVPMKELGEVLEAGTCAPSAGNLQNWKFVVVTDEEKRAKIATACLDQQWMKNAPTHVIICNEAKKITDMYPTRGKLYATQACAIATQNMMLKATALGINSCWVGAFNEEAVKRIVNIPEDIVPELIITLGYGPISNEPLDRNAADKVTYFNEYGNKTMEKSMFPLNEQGKVLATSFQRVKEQPKEGFLKRLFKR